MVFETLGSEIGLSSPVVLSAFGAVAIALLVVIILFMSYFNILRAIASFSYSNETILPACA